MRHKMMSIAFLVFGVVGLAMGIGLVVGAGAKRGWPTAPGHLVARGIKLAPSGSSKGYARYEPDVKYTFTVDGKQHTGTRFYPDHVTGYKDKVQKLVDEAPDTLAVHYQPGNPSESYLFPSPGWLGWLFIVVGALFALLGTLLLFGQLAGRSSS